MADFELIRVSNESHTQLAHAMDAWNLWRARQASPSLARELPYPNTGYKNPWRAYQCLGQAASTASDDFLPYVITRPGRLDSKVAVGMATIELRKPDPDYIRTKQQVELSYWHGILDSDESYNLGSVVVAELVEEAGGNFPSVDAAWMLTLTDDQAKQQVLEARHFRLRGGELLTLMMVSQNTASYGRATSFKIS